MELVKTNNSTIETIINVNLKLCKKGNLKLVVLHFTLQDPNLFAIFARTITLSHTLHEGKIFVILSNIDCLSSLVQTGVCPNSTLIEDVSKVEFCYSLR